MKKRFQKNVRKTGAALGVGALGLAAFFVGNDRAAKRAAIEATAALVAPGPGAAVAGPVPTSWDLPNLDHDRVEYWIGRFQTDKRQDLETYLKRMGHYATLISAELTRREMPQDLVYLAMIESGFNPKAYSHARASGLWQFIGATALRYGLDINRAVDERNDPVKATTAALDYLSDLHDRFGSWYLAAAAYNMGENGLTRILRSALGRTRGTDEDYYKLWNRLPRETRDYVPIMVAAARISKEPLKYGFTQVEPFAPLAFQEVVAAPATPLLTLAKRAGTTVAQIRTMNPHLKLNRTRNDEPMIVRVPAAGVDVAAVGAAD
ncbi:MAG TPA: lytic transglycosylase domain-containing protein [Vicinamibacteria bacterium]|nr:lytic transglycosylase domain-containing protein [Vicinamibacteria bacterium]